MAVQKYCPNCAGANPPDAKFCATCGAAMISAAEQPHTPSPPPSPPSWHPPLTPPPQPRPRFKKRYVLYGFVVLIVLAVVASALWQTSRTPVTADYAALSVNSMTTSSQLGSYPLQSTPSPSNTYVVFDVTLTNQNKDNLYLGNPLYFTLTTSDGTAYQYSPSSTWLDNPLTGVSNTNPGDKVTGKIAFEIPQSATPSVLTYGDQINGIVTVNLSGLSGASASASPTSTADYSSYFDTAFVNGNSTVTQPFTKSTNERGDDVYTGITKNPSASSTMTTVVELTKSEAGAQQLYNQTVAQKQSEGFTLRSDWVATTKARNPSIIEDWEGQQSSTGQQFDVWYLYDSHVVSWLFVTEAQG